MLNVNKTIEKDKAVFVLDGRLDTITSRDFEKTIMEELPGKTEVVLDFKDLEYISSAGLRIILSAQKTMNLQGVMKLIHVSDSIMEIFEMTGFAEILTIE